MGLTKGAEQSFVFWNGMCSLDIFKKKQCGTGRVSPEHLARPICQACTRIAVQPEVQVLVSSRAHLQSMLKNLVQNWTSASQLARFSRAKTKII